MDDRTAHYIVMVGDLCNAAHLGGLAIEVTTDTGWTVTGVPEARFAEEAASGEEVDATGVAGVVVNGSSIPADQVVGIRLLRP